MAADLNNITIETEGTEEEAEEGLEAAIVMEMEVMGDINGKGNEEGR